MVFPAKSLLIATLRVYKSEDWKCTVVSCSFKRYRIHRDYESIYRYLRLLCKAKASDVSVVCKGETKILNLDEILMRISVCNSSNLGDPKFHWPDSLSD